MEEPIQCLLVDDDPDDQEIFIMVLENIDKNIKCATANNGAEALVMLETKQDFVPAYIFMDVNMPKMNGIDCLKGIKDIRRLKNSKVFMYSTSSDPSIMQKSKELGAVDMIVKPTSPAVLKKILSGLLEN